MAEEIGAVVDSIIKSVDTIKTDAQKQQEELKKSLQAVEAKQKVLDDQILELQQKCVKVEINETKDASVGDFFIKSESYKKLAGSQSRQATVEIAKADINPIAIGNLMPPMRVAGVQAEPNQALSLEGLIPHLPTSASSIQYLREKEFTNNAAFIAEAALKPQSTTSFETTSTQVQTIAHWTKVTRQLIDDSSTLASFINARMVYGVDLAVEKQILSGDGMGENLSGLMKEGNYTKQVFTAGDLGQNATLLDLLRLSIALVDSKGYRANAIVLNPMDWAKLQGIKGTNAQYIYGVPSVSFENMRAWGVPVVTSATMEEGKYLVGDFAQAATIYDRMTTVIDIASQNENDFVRNLFTIRAERRLALAIEHTAALVGGSLLVPAAD